MHDNGLLQGPRAAVVEPRAVVGHTPQLGGEPLLVRDVVVCVVPLGRRHLSQVRAQVVALQVAVERHVDRLVKVGGQPRLELGRQRARVGEVDAVETARADTQGTLGIGVGRFLRVDGRDRRLHGGLRFGGAAQARAAAVDRGIGAAVRRMGELDAELGPWPGGELLHVAALAAGCLEDRLARRLATGVGGDRRSQHAGERRQGRHVAQRLLDLETLLVGGEGDVVHRHLVPVTVQVAVEVDSHHLHRLHAEVEVEGALAEAAERRRHTLVLERPDDQVVGGDAFDLGDVADRGVAGGVRAGDSDVAELDSLGLQVGRDRLAGILSGQGGGVSLLLLEDAGHLDGQLLDVAGAERLRRHPHDVSEPGGGGFRRRVVVGELLVAEEDGGEVRGAADATGLLGAVQLAFGHIGARRVVAAEAGLGVDAVDPEERDVGSRAADRGLPERQALAGAGAVVALPVAVFRQVGGGEELAARLDHLVGGVRALVELVLLDRDGGRDHPVLGARRAGDPDDGREDGDSDQPAGASVRIGSGLGQESIHNRLLCHRRYTSWSRLRDRRVHHSAEDHEAVAANYGNRYNKLFHDKGYAREGKADVTQLSVLMQTVGTTRLSVGEECRVDGVRLGSAATRTAGRMVCGRGVQGEGWPRPAARQEGPGDGPCCLSRSC